MSVPAADDDIPAIVAPMDRACRGAGEAAGWSTEAACIAGDRTTAALLRADLAAPPPAPC